MVPPLNEWSLVVSVEETEREDRNKVEGHAVSWESVRGGVSIRREKNTLLEGQ